MRPLRGRGREIIGDPPSPHSALQFFISQIEEKTDCLTFCLGSPGSAKHETFCDTQRKGLGRSWGCPPASLPEGIYLGELGRPWGHPQGSFKVVSVKKAVWLLSELRGGR